MASEATVQWPVNVGHTNGSTAYNVDTVSVSSVDSPTFQFLQSELAATRVRLAEAEARGRSLEQELQRVHTTTTVHAAHSEPHSPEGRTPVPAANALSQPHGSSARGGDAAVGAASPPGAPSADSAAASPVSPASSNGALALAVQASAEALADVKRMASARGGRGGRRGSSNNNGAGVDEKLLVLEQALQQALTEEARMKLDLSEAQRQLHVVSNELRDSQVGWACKATH